jgi:hypothetical protein
MVAMDEQPRWTDLPHQAASVRFVPWDSKVLGDIVDNPLIPAATLNVRRLNVYKLNRHQQLFARALWNSPHGRELHLLLSRSPSMLARLWELQSASTALQLPSYQAMLKDSPTPGKAFGSPSVKTIAAGAGAGAGAGSGSGSGSSGGGDFGSSSSPDSPSSIHSGSSSEGESAEFSPSSTVALAAALAPKGSSLTTTELKAAETTVAYALHSAAHAAAKARSADQPAWELVTEEKDLRAMGQMSAEERAAQFGMQVGPLCPLSPVLSIRLLRCPLCSACVL